MSFNQFVQNLSSKCFGIIHAPKKEWIKIKGENESFLHSFFSFLLPMLVLISIGSIIGSYFQLEGTEFLTDVVILSALRSPLCILISILLSIFAINALIGKYGGSTNLNHASGLVVYSFTPVLLVILILVIFPKLYFTGLFVLYSFYILFHGTPLLLDIPEARQSNFSTLSSTTILVIYLIVNRLLFSFFQPN